jgi:O-antigen/teichoic acid export membrane protein
MFQKNKLFKSLSVFFVFNALNSAVPLILLPFLTRHLSPEHYGILSVYTTISAILSAFVGLSSNSMISIKYFYLNTKEFYQYISSVLTILFSSLLLVILVLFVFQKPIFNLTRLEFKWVFLAAIFSSFQFISQIILSIWQSSGKAYLYGLFNFSFILLNLFLSYILISFFNYGWEGRVIAQLFIGFIGALIALFYLFSKKVKFYNLKYVKEVIKISLPIIPHSLAGTIFNFADRLIINRFLTSSNLGIYTIAFQLGSGVNIITDAYCKSLMPFVAEKIKEDTIEGYIDLTKVFIYSFIASILIFILSFLFLQFIFEFVVPNPEYLFAKSLIIYFLIGNIFHALYYNFVDVLFVFQKTKIIATITIGTSITSLLLSYLLIQTHGLLGIIYVYIFNRGIILLLTFYFSSRLVNYPWLTSVKIILSKTKTSSV